MVPYEPACIRLVVEAKVANILVDHPEGLSVSEIAKETIIEQGKLSRILRFLATKNCFREGT
jgi:DNA-binding IclR family transcriptional regulator